MHKLTPFINIRTDFGFKKMFGTPENKQMEEKDWNDCGNETERLMYLIKNMDKLDKNSEIYKCRSYQDFFDAAETDNMVNDEAVAYSQSLQRLEDIQSAFDYQTETARAQGLDEGRAEGRAEGKEQTSREYVTNMLKAGLEPEFIHKITGMPIQEINKLR